VKGDAPPPDEWVDLYWVPLGAGDTTHLVAASGRAYEWLAAHRSHRRPQQLFHSALLVRTDATTYAIEMGPVWRTADSGRGATGEGPVGAGRLGRSRFFRYEVRCWPGGRIPDLAEAVDSPVRMSEDGWRARRVLDLAPQFPRRTWGRDEQRTGDMWNSNSLISWLLTRSGHDLNALQPPCHGRAPGWEAGIVAARSIIEPAPR